MLSRDLAFHIHGMLFGIGRTSRRFHTAARRVRALHFGQRVAAQFVSKDKMERYVHPLPVYQILAFEVWICVDGRTRF
jgi:hypothetical protein